MRVLFLSGLGRFSRLIAAVLFAGIVARLPAAPDSAYYSERWLVDEGLPHNIVNRIVQDGRGFLWAATADGLARFDGRQFREFQLPESGGRASRNIRDIALEDPNTLALIPSRGGIFRLRDGVFTPHPASEAVSGKAVLNLFFEPNGALWLGLDGPEVMRWQGGKFTVLGAEQGLARRSGGRHFFATDGDGRTWISSGDFLGWYRDGRLIRVPIETRTAIAIASARSGGIWIATNEQLLKWEDEHLTVVCPRGSWLPPAAATQQMYEDHAGVLWIGTRREGLFRLANGKPIVEATEHFQIAAMTEDRENNLWVSMDGGGINRLRAKTFAVLDSTAGLPDDISTSICEDSAGAIWCANRAGGVVRMEAGKKTRAFSRTVEGWPIYASNICPDNAGNVWVGALAGLYRVPIDPKRPLERVSTEIQPVRVLYCSRRGDVWVGWGFPRGEGFQLGYFRDGKYRRLSLAENFHGKHVSAIAEAPDGTIWIGSEDGELFEFRDDVLVQRRAESDGLAGRIHALHFDRQGTLWISTERGLVMRDGERVRRFTRTEGLPDDLVMQMLEDDDGRLWLCSRRGFFSVSTADLRELAAGKISRVAATTFGRDEGLPGISAPTGGQPMSWKARDGRLWFVTNRGVIGFDPKASLPTRPAPTVYIDETVVDGKTMSAGADVHVRSGAQRVEFRFVALNYSAPAKVRLRHRLMGFDQDWVETETDRSAAYVRLPPGNYSMHVIAANQDGLWNNVGATLTVVVAPAWWQTWWWRLAAVLAFTGVVAAIARFYFLRRLKFRLEGLEREHALEKERARIARDLHDDLGGSLTQIGMLADRLTRQAITPEVKQGLGRLATRTRGLAGELESIVWTVSPKNNTWDRLAAFIAQFARRFFHDTAIECSVEGADAIPAFPLTPDAQHHVLSVVKEALNNVLKHSRGTAVKLSLSFNANVFELRIRDNGVGFNPAALEHAERNGLANMRSRMEELGGKFEIVSTPGSTEITVRLPQSAGAGAGTN